jgi:glycosyltransferase involved in cell wall biosynthesis
VKVLLVHNHYSSVGGESRVFSLEREALEKALGAERVFTLEAGSPRYPISLVFSIFFSFRKYRKVYRLVKENKIDIVHVHNFFPIFSASIFFAAKHAGAKTVHCLHNYRWWCINGNFFRNGKICTACADKKSLLSGIQYGCYRESTLQSFLAVAAFSFYKAMGVLGRIDAFVAMTHFQQMKLIALGLDPQKIYIKPNMVPAVQPPVGVRNGYLYVGRLEVEKGILLLLENWSRLPPEFELTIIGGGSIEKSLREKYQQSNIHFMGICSPDETLRCMATSRYTIQPSLMFETFGLTIIESMCMGVPVIALNIGTRMELVQDRITGFLSSPENLYDTIKIADEFDGYDAMSKAAFQFASAFDTSKVIEEQLSLYQTLLRQPQ